MLLYVTVLIISAWIIMSFSNRKEPPMPTKTYERTYTLEITVRQRVPVEFSALEFAEEVHEHIADDVFPDVTVKAVKATDNVEL